MGHIFDTSTVSAIINDNKKIVKRMEVLTDKGEQLFLSVITD